MVLAVPLLATCTMAQLPATVDIMLANTGTPDMYRKLDDVKWEMLEAWNKTKRAPRHAAWMHEKEFS